MNSSTLATSFLHLKTPSSNPSPILHFTPLKSPSSISTLSLKTITRASSSNHNSPPTHTHPVIHTLKSLAKTAVFVGAAAFVASKFSVLPAVAETSVAVEEERAEEAEEQSTKPPLAEFIESNPEAIESLKSLLQEKLDNGDDKEALKILQQLVSAQPSVLDYKFLMARLLSEMGEVKDARKVFEEILAANPLSFEALFENALLMDRCGEGEGVIKRLEEALEIAEENNKVKEARDVRLIMAQIQFLQKDVEEALKSYEKLSKEDPGDFRPYFCRGMIYSLLDRNEEANVQFAKYRELSPKKFEVEGYLRTPLSRMKMFGSQEEN